MSDLQYSQKAKDIKLGIYEHHKGRRYAVLSIARHSETLEEFVVYKALYDDGDIWVRPVDMFTEEVEKNGKIISRFKYIGE